MRIALRTEESGGVADEPLVLDTRALQNALVERIALRHWPARILNVPALVLDGPVWLKNRPSAVDALRELIRERAKAGRRTLVCQSDEDCSVEVLLGEMEAGSTAVIGLRFPKGPRGRLRFARRMCDDLGLSTERARSTEAMEPWGYEAVIGHLKAIGREVSDTSGQRSKTLRPAMRVAAVG
jgi:hypothetical protein